MEKLLSIILTVAMLVSVSSMTITDAADTVIIDRLEFTIDYPVDGVELKTTEPYITIEEYSDYLGLTHNEAGIIPVKIGRIVWYSEDSPSSPLPQGTKAELGKKYKANFIVYAQDGYAFCSNMQDYNNTINGITAHAYSFSGGGVTYWAFETEFTAVAAQKGDPVVNIKYMNLSPYEGCPAEVQVAAKGGTNLKYQWQICYGDYEDGTGGIEFSGIVEIDDNYHYEGTKTDHFKLHTYFGCNIDVELGFCEIRCKVTSDTGVGYSQPVWFAIIDRSELNYVTVYDLESPSYGKFPDREADTREEEFSVGSVEWYGPKNSKGEYPVMAEGEKFGVGEYYCSVEIIPEVQYKFASDSKTYLNNEPTNLHIEDGSEFDHPGADRYYVRKNFTIENNNVSQVDIAGIVEPMEGMSPEFNAYIVQSDTTNFATGKVFETENDFLWLRQRAYMDPYVMTSTDFFTIGNKNLYPYYHSVVFLLEAAEGKVFTDDLAVTINGKAVPAENVISLGDESSDFPPSKYRYVIYHFMNVKEADLVVKYTADSNWVYGGTVAVDSDAMAEMKEDFAEAYFSDSVTYQWYRFDLKEAETTVIEGATNASYTISDEDTGKLVYATVSYNGKIVTGSSFLVPSTKVTVRGAVNGIGVDTNVLVELYKEGSDTPEYGTSVTGADRYYIFENVPIGNYTLKATAPDHKDYIQQITVTSVGLIFDFTMKDASTPGDVNRDTNINLADVSLMLKYIAKWDVEMDTDAADVTGEGKINLGDVSLMLKYIAKWDVVLK